MERAKEKTFRSDDGAEAHGTLIPYERSIRQRNICIGGLVFTWILSIASIGYGAHAVMIYPASVEVEQYASVGLTFMMNIIITVCSALMSTIHSATLRSALLLEGRLEFNSSMRFFKRSATSWAHGALMNTLMLFCLVLSYASISQAWVSYDGFSLTANGVPFLTLGCGLGGQAAVTTWCLCSINPPTWSSHPMNMALVALHHGHQRVPGRAMLGVESASKPSTPQKPQAKQPKARNIISLVKRLDRFVLMIGVLAPAVGGIWTGVASALDAELWILLPSSDGGSSGGTSKIQLLGYIFAICALQSIFTIGTLVLDYQILVMSDERAWRQLSRPEGIQLSKQTTSSALRNPFVVFLYLFQALVHWLFGLGIRTSFDDGFNMAPGNFMSCVIALLWLMAIARLGNHWQPKGPLPATYGHVQTILNLVDVWGHHLWWGDKGPVGDGSAVRKAGTATSVLASIKMDREYQ
jgi:hypothetical protein